MMEIRTTGDPTGQDARLTVSFSGALDCAHTSSLRDLVEELLSHRPTQLTLDLTGVTYLDAAVAREIAAQARRATADKSRLMLITDGNRHVRRVLSLAGWSFGEPGLQAGEGAGSVMPPGAPWG